MKTTVAGILLYVLTLLVPNTSWAVPPSNPNHQLHQMKPKEISRIPVFCYGATEFYKKVLSPDQYKMVVFEMLRDKKGNELGIRAVFRNNEKSTIMVLFSEKKQTACISPFSTMDKSITNGPII